MRKNSIKNTRVNAEVQRELSNILRGGIKDPHGSLREAAEVYEPQSGRVMRVTTDLPGL